jgi:hypothetical protein
MIHKQPWRGPNRWDTRDRYDLANAYRLMRQLQGALNRLPEHKLGRLVDLRDTLEKFHESRPTHSKRNV